MNRHDLGKASSLAMVLMLAGGGGAFGQDPALLSYHPPRIALVQPGEGAVLEQDRPIVVVRFASGEAGDPVDVRSFAIAVDAKDQTNLFQVSANEAWGSIAALPSELSLGTHEVAARICSARGACSSTTSTLTVSKPLVAVTETASAKSVVRKRRVINALLSALRTLLKE